MDANTGDSENLEKRLVIRVNANTKISRGKGAAHAVLEPGTLRAGASWEPRLAIVGIYRTTISPESAQLNQPIDPLPTDCQPAAFGSLRRVFS
jgi:hypothetical protein